MWLGPISKEAQIFGLWYSISSICGDCCVAPPRAMSILCWNCRGLGNPWTIRDLRGLIQILNPFIVFLSKTKCFKNKIDSIRLSLDFDCGFYVEVLDFFEIMMLMFCSSVTLLGILDVSIVLCNSINFRFTYFYGNPKTELRCFS